MKMPEKKQKKQKIMKVKSQVKIKSFRKKDIPKLRYGVIHSQVGFADGVSIVMRQIESVMTGSMEIPKSNIYYLVGKSKGASPQIRQREILWHKNRTNQLLNKYFDKGFGGALSERIEMAIWSAKEEIKKFVCDKKIDVIIAHNTSHPVNFVLAVALSRYYRDEIDAGRKPPKYILWWHDSHLERERYSNPAPDINNYLLEGVPGKYVEYIVFINRLQFDQAQKYLMELDSRSSGFYDQMLRNHTVIYNTATTMINTVEDLESDEKITVRTEKFLEGFGINKLLKKRRLKLDDVQFVLQHTRIVPRKRIDFALEYSYELFCKLKKDKKRKAMVFFVSGPHGDERGNYKGRLIRLNRKLSQKYKTNKFFLVFAEDYKTEISFEEMPLIIAKLGGVTTYFSEIEGFGNNLLEVFAAGLIPAVYTYPVFVKDLARQKFKAVVLDKFEVSKKSVNEMLHVIESDRVKKSWANQNLEILKKKFSHEIIAPKLKRAVVRRRVLRK